MRASQHLHRAGQLSKNTIEWFKKGGQAENGFLTGGKSRFYGFEARPCKQPYQAKLIGGLYETDAGNFGNSLPSTGQLSSCIV
jgi:hypothetical protein